MRFVGEAIAPQGAFATDATATGEPAVPGAFTWRGETLSVAAVTATRRGLKSDRGEDYLKKHYFDVALTDGRTATIYLDRHARPGAPRWWLYTISR